MVNIDSRIVNLNSGEEVIMEEEFNDVDEALQYFRDQDMHLLIAREILVDEEGRGINYHISINYESPYKIVTQVVKDN